MKKIFLWASLCLFAVSCSNETIESDNGVTNAEKVLAPVTVRVNGFSVTQEEMASGGTTRAAQTAASYTYRTWGQVPVSIGHGDWYPFRVSDETGTCPRVRCPRVR